MFKQIIIHCFYEVVIKTEFAMIILVLNDTYNFINAKIVTQLLSLYIFLNHIFKL